MTEKRNLHLARPAELMPWVRRFHNVPVLIVGDLMVDRSLFGRADRISPEAPVPVVDVKDDVRVPGGAGNVAANIAALGGRPTLLTVRGDDHEGELVEGLLESRGIALSGLVTDPDRPTIVKTRLFAGHQQVARYDREARRPLPHAVQARVIEEARHLVSRSAGVVISDYGKGVVTPQVIAAVIKAAHKAGIPVTVDPKIEHFQRYKGVDTMTPNTKEAAEGMRTSIPTDEDGLIRLGWSIVKKLSLKSLLITRGEKGMTLFMGGRTTTIPTQAREVYDVTGAGDTVVSTFTLARAVGMPHLRAAQMANYAASIVVAKVGTAVASADQLSTVLKAAR